ncbi:cupin domain-containing protein [Opitutaceae bacterium TAV1]|nr:cupin domain-containing protein [Opitutaceae bacterium TAV1]
MITVRSRLLLAAILASLLPFFVAPALRAATAAAEADSPYAKAVAVTPLLKTQTDGAGQPIVYPADGPAEVSAVLVEIAPGRQTNWHRHPVPCFGYMLEGEVRVELAGGETRTFRAGEAFAEVVNVLHNGTNPGPGPARLVMFVTGTAGRPYAEKTPAPAAATPAAP